MNQIELANRNEIDREILVFTREMQRLAPVTAESIESFLRVQRARRLRASEVADRMAYLADAGYLAAQKEWRAGEIMFYRITALGMDYLDGAIPPRNWRNEQ